MAGFTTDLQDPSRQYAPYPQSGGGSSGGVLADAARGISGIAGKVFQREGETARAEGGNKLVTDLTDTVLSKANEPTTPPLVGQPSQDPATAAGANSATGKQVASDLNRLSQTSEQQGPGFEQQKLIRANTIVQQAIQKDPLHADYYRGLAQQTLGVTPTAELFKLQNEAEQFTTTMNHQVFQTNVQAAANAGVTPIKDGQPDLQSMASQGAEILANEHKTATAMKDAQLYAEQNKSLSREDRIDMETGTVMKGLQPTMTLVHDTILKNIPELIQKYSAAGNDKAILMLGNDLNNQEAQTMNYINGFIIQNGVSTEAAAKVRTEVHSMFADYRTLFGSKDESLDTVNTNARTLKDFNTVSQIQFTKTAPVAARVKAVIGDQGIAALFSQNTVLASDVAGAMQTGVNDYLHSKPDAADAASATLDALSGGHDVSQEQRPNWQSATTRGVVAVTNKLVQTPDKLNPSQQSAFGHAMVQISNVALNDRSPKNLEGAASVINSPAVTRTFMNYAKNPANANQVPTAALGMSSLLYQHIATARQTIAQGASISLTLPQAVPPGGLSPTQERYGYTESQSVGIKAGAVYNPQTGKVEFTMTATGPDGKPYKLNPQQTAQATKNFSDYANTVTQVNKSLDALTVLKDYTHEGTDQLKPMDMKGLVIMSAGLPVKAGMSIPKPTLPGQTGQEGQPGKTQSGITFTQGVHKLEGGNAGQPQKNPQSSASGVGQFIKSTWIDLAKEKFPDEVKGKSDTDILALRSNAPFADRMIEAYKMQNASRLHAAGIDNPDNAELYMAHHFGAHDAIKIMNAPLRARIEDIVSPEVLKHNPDLKGMTPIKLYQKYAQAF